MACKITVQPSANTVSNIEVTFSELTLNEVLALKNALKDYSATSFTSACLLNEFNKARAASKIF